MRIGTSLDIVSRLPVEEALEKVVRAGFRQVELAGWSSAPDNPWRDPRALGRTLDAAGVSRPTMHSPGAGWNNGTGDEAARAASIDTASAAFAPAREAGARIVVCHPNMSSDAFTPEDYDNCVARSMDSLRILAERARQTGIRMAVENLPRRGKPRPGGTVAEVLRMIDGLGDHVGLCLDVGHANANGLSVVDELREAAPRLFCMHLSDNDGRGEDQHLFPGTGTLPFDQLVEALARFAPDVPVNFEVPGPRDETDRTLVALAQLVRSWDGRDNRAGAS